MKPYIVLGTYKPSRWRASLVGRDLTDLTSELGLLPHIDKAHGPLNLSGRNWSSTLLHAEVRRRTFRTKQAEDWHYDSDLEPNGNPNCAIVLWCSNNATQIKWQDKYAELDQYNEGLWQPKDYEVVIFHNMHCLHRRPPNVPRIRWVYRQRVCVPEKSVLELP